MLLLLDVNYPSNVRVGALKLFSLPLFKGVNLFNPLIMALYINKQNQNKETNLYSHLIRICGFTAQLDLDYSKSIIKISLKISQIFRMNLVKANHNCTNV